LTAHEEYRRLGRNETDQLLQSAHRELFQAAILSNDLAAIRECTHKGWVLGDERFKEQIEALATACRVERCGQAEEGQYCACPLFPWLARVDVASSRIALSRSACGRPASWPTLAAVGFADSRP
jgi:hypothetical protein